MEEKRGKDFSESISTLDNSENYIFYSEDNCIYAESKDEKVIIEKNTLNISPSETQSTPVKNESFDELSYEEKIDAIESNINEELEKVDLLSPTNDEETLAKKTLSIMNSSDSKTIASKENSVTPNLLQNGFTSNTPNSKYLDMNGCLVNQQDSSGKEHGMCWAASVATIVRYSTGNRTLRAWDVCNTMGIGYDDGGTMQDMKTALEKYNIRGYNVIYNQCSWSQITSDISNQKPIAVGATTTTPYYGQYLGHAVTVTGYSSNYNNYNTIQIWNSGNQQNQVVTYSTYGSTFPYANFNWVWDSSVF